MKRSRLEQMLGDRFREQSRLIHSAAKLMLRCIDWPEKQDEPFFAVTEDMTVWLKEMRQLYENLHTDLEELTR